MKDGDFPIGLAIIIGAAVLGVFLVAAVTIGLFLVSAG
jgi:hypothetical protein